MKKRNSIINVAISVLSTLLNIVLGFILQKIFLSSLGAEYSGLNSLFTSIFSVLAFFELGIGTAVIYHLYKPVNENDIETIKSLMTFYKKSYQVVACIILIVGCCLLPFIPMIIGTIGIEVNIYIIYFLYLIDVISSYLLSYKRSILNAHQEKYILELIHILYILGMNITQITILLIYKNFHFFIFVRILFRLLENIIISIIANKRYPYIKDKGKSLSNDMRSEIYQMMKGVIYFKIGNQAIGGADNIIISIFLSVTTIGLYANYKMIVGTIQTIIITIFNSLIAGIGTYFVQHKSNSKSLYDKLFLYGFLLISILVVGFFNCMDDFIKIWIGEEYILPHSFLICISIYLFISLIYYVNSAFKDACGVYYEDRYVPFVRVFINIGISILLVNSLGLNGVIIGTICSELFIILFDFPIYVYKKEICKSVKKYYDVILKYAILILIELSITFMICNAFSFENSVLNLIKNGIISIFITCFINFNVFKSNKNLKLLIQEISKLRRV